MMTRRSEVRRRPMIPAGALALLLVSGAAAPRAGQAAPIHMGPGIEPPVRTVYVEPRYPEELEREGLGGNVGLEVVVGLDGSVEVVGVIRSNPPLDEAAIAAVKQWRYQPARKDGQPISVYLTVVVQFAPKGSQADEPPIYLSAGVTPPKRVTYVAPAYPPEAKKAGKEGRVTLELVVGPAGDVLEARTLESDPLFDDAAIIAVLQWKFKPATKDGRPVKVYLTVIVAFELD